MPIRLTMICSGATAAMRKASFPLDEALEERSEARAAAMREELRRADRVWTSPALRARQTATALGLGLEASIEASLRDLDLGAWAGRSLADVGNEQPDAAAVWLSDPRASPHGGESLADMSRRVGILMEGLLHDSGHTIAVTHAAVIRAAILHVLGAPLDSVWRLDIEPLSITDFRGDGRRWVLRSSGVPVRKPPRS